MPRFECPYPTSMKKVILSKKIHFFDTDCGGVVSNIAYLRFIEEARTELYETLGMDLVSMTESAVFPVVVRTEVDYRTPARLGDTLRIEGTFEKMGKVRSICRFVITTGEKTVAESRQTVALVQMPSGKPLRTPREWLEITG